MGAIPQFHGMDGGFSFQVLCSIPIMALLSYSTLYKTDIPTCPVVPFMTGKRVTRNAYDPPQYQAPLIHNHITFNCYIAFFNIIMSCDMPSFIPFTIHIFVNAWRLIICLREHRTFAFRLALDAHRSATN